MEDAIMDLSKENNPCDATDCNTVQHQKKMLRSRPTSCAVHSTVGLRFVAVRHRTNIFLKCPKMSQNVAPEKDVCVRVRHRV
jgi:hypothetical protein